MNVPPEHYFGVMKGQSHQAIALRADTLLELGLGMSEEERAEAKRLGVPEKHYLIAKLEGL